VSLTSDRNDPELRETKENGMMKKYLVLSDEELQQEFVRPVRKMYVHHYMEDGSKVPTVLVSLRGVKGCGGATTMNLRLAETYARNPKYYGATFCVMCQTHLPVAQFHWEDGEVLGS
jgi:hypothetical protein